MSSSSPQDEKAGRYGILVRLLDLIPTILLIIVVVSIVASLVNYIASRLRPLVTGGLDIYSLTSAVLDQLKKIYYSDAPEPSAILGILAVSILMSLLSWKLTSYYVIGTLMLSVASCLILASIGAVEYVSMLNVLFFWLLNFFFYTTHILSCLVEWAGRQASILISLTIATSTLTFLSAYIDKKSGEISGKRLSEKSITKYALLGGGLGVIVGAHTFKHKTLLKDSFLLSKIVLATFAILYILATALLTAPG